jgi:hypothetical protein
MAQQQQQGDLYCCCSIKVVSASREYMMGWVPAYCYSTVMECFDGSQKLQTHRPGDHSIEGKCAATDTNSTLPKDGKIFGRGRFTCDGLWPPNSWRSSHAIHMGKTTRNPKRTPPSSSYEKTRGGRSAGPGSNSGGWTREAEFKVIPRTLQGTPGRQSHTSRFTEALYLYGSPKGLTEDCWKGQ